MAPGENEFDTPGLRQSPGEHVKQLGSDSIGLDGAGGSAFLTSSRCCRHRRSGDWVLSQQSSGSVSVFVRACVPCTSSRGERQGNTPSVLVGFSIF